MKLPLYWLKKYMDVTWPAEKLAAALTMSGSKVERVWRKAGESVIEIEVTTNRPDCLSLLGLAHEVAALTGKPVKAPAAYAVGRSPRRKSKAPVEIFVEDRKGCPRYTARLIENVRVAPALADTKKCLELVDTRPISNVVDATNFVLFECGQPLHAFDFDKLAGGVILVRRARTGEKFLGIDGVEYTLDDKTLVIADAEKAVAIAGVIGGKSTEVTESTRRVLLESAYFDPALVRQASKHYKISTESSYRFERRVNPDRVGPASDRAAQLIAAWANGKDVSGLLDKNYLPKPKREVIGLRLDRVAKFLGMAVPPKRAARILKSLSFQVKSLGKDKFGVLRSEARADVCIEADLVEEILRIEGFDKIPSRIPVTRHTLQNLQDRKKLLVPEIKKYLAAVGFHEIITYSLLSSKAFEDSGWAADSLRSNKIKNPVSAEQEWVRPSLLPGVLQAVLYNIHHKASNLRFFEIGKVYDDTRKNPEQTSVGLALYGNFEENWRRKSAASYYDLKGALENLFSFLNVGMVTWAEETPAWASAGNHVRLPNEAEPVARLGAVSPEILRRWDIPHEVFFAEISLDRLLELPAKAFRVQPVPKFPSVRRDIAFLVDERVTVSELEGAMRQAASGYLKETTLFDQYIGKNIPAGRRSLAFSLEYQKETGTFTDEEIQSLQGRVGDALKTRFSVEFR